MYDRPVQLWNGEDFLCRLAVAALAPQPVHFRGELPEARLAGVAPIRLAYRASHYNSVVPAQPAPGDEVPPLRARHSAVIR